MKRKSKIKNREIGLFLILIGCSLALFTFSFFELLQGQLLFGGFSGEEKVLEELKPAAGAKQVTFPEFTAVDGGVHTYDAIKGRATPTLEKVRVKVSGGITLPAVGGFWQIGTSVSAGDFCKSLDLGKFYWTNGVASGVVNNGDGGFNCCSSLVRQGSCSGVGAGGLNSIIPFNDFIQ